MWGAVRSVLEALLTTYNRRMNTRLIKLLPVIGLLWLTSCGQPQAIEQSSAVHDRLPEMRMRVRTSEVAYARLGFDQSFTGIVEPFREAMVAAEVGGRVVARRIEPGDTVKSGDVLVRLDAARLAIARDRAAAARASREVELSDATRDKQRGQRLFDTGAISDNEFDDLALLVEKADAALDMADAALRDAEKDLADAAVLVPFDGRVEVVRAQVGDYLVRGQQVAKLVDFSKARIGIGVTAGQAASLETGQPARIGVESVQAGVLDGVIQSIGRSSSDTGLFPVEIWVEGESAAHLRQGMAVSVDLEVRPDFEHLLVPSGAVLRRRGITHVFRVDAEQRARLVPVATGLTADGRVQILRGLSEGDEVITEGQFALSDGALVDIIR